MSSWLKCSLEAGMLPDEYAVEIDTLESGKVSLFAWNDKIQLEDSLVSVEPIAEDEGGVLVRLPSYPFEIPSRRVRVSRSNLVTQ